MKINRDPLWKLLHVREYIFFVIFTTLLGIIAARGNLGWHFLLILAANFLVTALAYVFNDIQDAPQDAVAEGALTRNPIAAGLISGRQASWIALAGLLAAVGAYAILGWRVLLFGLLGISISWLYSARALQNSGSSLLDRARHAWLLAGFHTLTAYYSFSAKGSLEFIVLLVFIVSLSLYGEVSNELRSQTKGKLRQQLLAIFSFGERTTHLLLIFLLAAAAVSGLLAFFVYKVLPSWVFLLIIALSTILLAPALLRPDPNEKREESRLQLHKPLEKAGAIALVVYFVVPLILKLINP